MVRSFFKLLNRYPFASNVAVYAGLYGAGDICRQTIGEKRKFDRKSVQNMSIVGGCIIGPVFHHWYRFLDQKLPGRSTGIVVRKLIYDQLLGVPTIIVFFVVLSILEGQTSFFKDAVEKGPKTYATGCIYFPSVQALNFYYVSTKFRAVYVAIAEFVWTIVLSFFKSSKSKS